MDILVINNYIVSFQENRKTSKKKILFKKEEYLLKKIQLRG